MRRHFRHVLLGVGLMAFAAPALAEPLEDIILASSAEADASEEPIPKAAAEIFLTGTITDEVPTGSKLTVAWIAVDSGGAAPPNYQIITKDFDIGQTDNHLEASITQPNTGWPVGSYEIQLIVDGKLAQTLPFTIK